MPPNVAHDASSSSASNLKNHPVAKQQTKMTARNANKTTVARANNATSKSNTRPRRSTIGNTVKHRDDQQIVKRGTSLNNKEQQEETEINASATTASPTSPLETSPMPMQMQMSTTPYNSMMGGGMGGMGMGMGGMGMGMGMGGMNMMGGMGGYGMGQGGHMSSLSQYLFSFQSIIFSLGQAMQIVTMNTHQLHQLYDQIMVMLDQALKYLDELKHLESLQTHLQKPPTEEQIKKRRRLKAIRWSIMFGISYAGYKFVLKWYRKRKEYTRARTRISRTTRTSMPGHAQLQSPLALHNNRTHDYGQHGRTMNGGYYNQDQNQNHSPQQQNDYYSSYPSTSTYSGGYPGGYNSNYSPF